MTSNFIVAVSAVVPMFILMAIGASVKWAKLLTDSELKRINRVVFMIFFSCMIFYNLYITDLESTFKPKLMIFGAGGVLAIFFISLIIVQKFEPDRRRRGVIVQSLFRSNYVIMGVPIVANIFGDQNIATTTMMIAIIVPIYNILGVFSLEIFRDDSSGSLLGKIPHMLLDVLKNPMIVGAIVGAIFLILEIHIPEPILRPIRQLSSATTPVALVILGASFKLDSTASHRKELISCMIGRLILVPAIMMTIAIELGFRDVDFVTLLSIFATPCAVASFVMAQQMGGDAELAGSCVVFSSAISCVTLFGWILLFKTLGFF